MSGRATASMVELSGRSVTANATAATTARCAGRAVVMASRSTDDADDARIAVDLDGLAVGDRLGGEAGADHGGNAVLAGHHRGVAEHATGVGDDRAGRREQRRPWRGGGLRPPGGARAGAGGGGGWAFLPRGAPGGTPPGRPPPPR